MEIQSIIVLLGTLASGGTVGAFISSYFTKKKTKAEAEYTVGKNWELLTKSLWREIDAMKDQLKEKDKSHKDEIAALRDTITQREDSHRSEIDKLKRENESLRNKNTELENRVAELEGKKEPEAAKAQAQDAGIHINIQKPN